MSKPDEAAAWLGVAVNYPNIILGIMIGSAITFILFHKGWITLPSIVQRMDDLRDAHAEAISKQESKYTALMVEHHQLLVRIQHVEEALASANSYFEFKDKLAISNMNSLLPSGSYTKIVDEK